MMELPNRWKEGITPYSKPSQDYINHAMKQFEEVVEDFCNIAEFEVSRIKFNIPALEDVIVRTDMRVLYFAVFHQEMKPNEYKKITGLLIFWILKRHPFWVDTTKEDSEDTIRLASCINEKIALHMALTLLNEYNSNFFEHGEDLVESYARELEYSFTYRDLSKESLFLLFDPFYYEHIFANSYANESIVF